MEHDDEPVGRIITRRQSLKILGAGGISLVAGASHGQKAPSTQRATSRQVSNQGCVDLVVAPELTEGPFFVDEMLLRSDLASGTDRTSVVNGLPFTLQVTVYEVNGSQGCPLAGAYVDLWHADAVGAYSDVNNQGIQSENTLGQTWLRGYQITDSNGIATFQTIYPGWYIGRTIHFHFKIRRYNASSQQTFEFTSQWFIDDTINDAVLSNAPYNSRGDRSVRNSNDNIYANRQADNTLVGSHLTLNVSDTAEGKLGTFSVGIDSEEGSSSAQSNGWAVF